MALLLGCPTMGDGAVEQERRKGATSAVAGLSYSGRRTSGAIKKKERDKEGKKKRKCGQEIKGENIKVITLPTVIATWFVNYFRKGQVCTVK